MPNCACILSHNNVLEMESNAFRKFMKQAKVHLSFANRFFILKHGVTWSWQLWPLQKPFFSSAKSWLHSRWSLRRVLRIEQRIFITEDWIEIPLQSPGSRELPLDLGISWMILWSRWPGTFPCWRQVLKKECMNSMHRSFFKKGNANTIRTDLKQNDCSCWIGQTVFHPEWWGHLGKNFFTCKFDYLYTKLTTHSCPCMTHCNSCPPAAVLATAHA